ncbi:TonB C-terminal domain-containing protein, partial [bacterium]|nr:TonB C-terminal domain-containing protein [bacterium]
KKEEKKVVKNKKIKTENKKVVKKKKPIKTVDNKTEKKPIKKLQGNLKKVDHVQQEVEGLSPVYVGQEEMAALTMQKELQQEVGKCWRPPVGLPKDLVCILKVLVDWSGKVNQAAVQKGSGVLMYDISARTAVAKMQLQKKAYGKEFTITFKQQMETV